MPLSQIIEHLADAPAMQALERAARERKARTRVHGLVGSLRAFAIARIRAGADAPILAVVGDNDRGEELRDDLETLLGEDRVRYFPAWEIPPYEERSPHLDVTGLRIEALESLLAGENAVVVTSIRALLEPTIPPYILELATPSLTVGGVAEMDDVAATLVGAGFEREQMVDSVGQFSIRGGILDVYPFGADDPIRVEFFGDEVESIRAFDVITQRSLRRMERASIFPFREVILHEDLREAFLENIERTEKEEEIALDELKERAGEGRFFDGIERYLPAIYGERSGLTAYLRPDTLVFLDDPEEIRASAEEALDALESAFHTRRRRGDPALSPTRLTDTFEAVRAELDEFPHVEHLAFRSSDGAPIEFDARGVRRYESDLKTLEEELLDLLDRRYRIHILCDNRGQAERLEELLPGIAGRVAFDVGVLSGGFILPDARLAVLNDHDIFSRYRRRLRYRRFKGGTPIPSFTALSAGDYVVHVDHGIGKYRGLRRLTVDGRERDCLQILYRDNDKLYVPVEQLDRVQKYSSEESAPPVLTKLGGTTWDRVKRRTRQAIFKMAKELVDLYAERKAREGIAFSPDTSWQRELEASFPYQETRDQLTAVGEVKEDLERPSPMDRLVCGDVGYGKTEVAVRAASKVVGDDRQVAVLVPTTILAQQHYVTFTERFGHFPVRVEVLSRFRTPAEQGKALKGLEDGTVDVVIGTHRLLSKDVTFKDLGLLVIDEEQRFGVRQKERIKQFKRLVDVLTLTATPIPRTLHMSLMGARDMSIINTPPKDRLPIHTEIIRFDEEKIAEAILREVDRGGQVFFVHNRVQSIEETAELLRNLVPQVRFVVAHGQMPERQLEQVMLDFLDRKYDCLISTMIIESGLDMPNVNTLIVDRADRFGLSELYQLRGRVGRSNLKAYAYLMTPPRRTLRDRARRRLRAIEEFSDLGSGFHIAMRDLEIRGAGNLLGPQQHGFIVAIGFDLYTRLLDEAIRELKGEDTANTPDPEIDIRVSAYLPDEYVEDSEQKVSFYQRLASTRRSVEILEIEEELEDRYGRIPPPAEALLNIEHIKALARQIGLGAVSMYDTVLRMVFPPERRLSPKEIEPLVQRCPLPLQFYLDENVAVEMELDGYDDMTCLISAKNAMERIVTTDAKTSPSDEGPGEEMLSV